jgi:hypothetical protein
MWVELLSAHKEFLTFKLEHELIVEGGGERCHDRPPVLLKAQEQCSGNNTTPFGLI